MVYQKRLIPPLCFLSSIVPCSDLHCTIAVRPPLGYRVTKCGSSPDLDGKSTMAENGRRVVLAMENVSRSLVERADERCRLFERVDSPLAG